MAQRKAEEKRSSRGEVERSSIRGRNYTLDRLEGIHGRSGSSSENHLLLQLQRRQGNQAVQRLVNKRIKSELEVGGADDKYEREADRMMRLPEPQTAEDPKQDRVDTHTADGEREQCHKRRLQRTATGSNPSGMLPLTSEVLQSPGRPLDPAVRRFMEDRFGHDFSQVRVHTDAKAADSARVMKAQAYTVQRDVVFGGGRYAPETPRGRRLLAHELTHVVQQTSVSNHPRRPKQFPTLSSVGNTCIQRSPDEPTQVERRRERRLKELAQWPSRAHDAWTKLNAVDRNLVVLQMASNYGVSFASEFLKVAEEQTYDLSTYYYGREVGPTPKKLVARGFQLAQKDSVHEWWVLPSGRTVVRNFTERKPTETIPEEETAGETVVEGTEDWPDRLDPNADRESLFGPTIAIRENADASFGTGVMVLYEDGTAELFLEGTTESYVFRPLPSGGYVVYGPDGQRLDMIWMIPEEELPDPNTDAVE